MTTTSVLVTGGAGFIASHVVDAYLARGLRVTVLDNLSTGTRANVNAQATFVEGDLNDESALARAIGEGVDIVNHHAAQMDVRKSVADPAFDAETNIVGGLRLLEAARRAGVKKVIFSSSGGAAYGEPEFYPQTEDHPMRPMSPYGCAKVAFEHYLQYYSAVYGIPHVALRYANVYGPRQRHDGEAGVIAIFIGKLLANETPVINGKGDQTRDYVFVDDVVRANVAALRDDIAGAFNVGTGVETTVVELFDSIRAMVSSDRRADHGPAKTGEQMRSVLDGSRLRNVTGLPEPTRLAEGLKATVEWVRSQSRR